MNGQDFATAVQYDLPVIVLVIDNRMYGTIRMHQEREFPGRFSATELKNPISRPMPVPSRAWRARGSARRSSSRLSSAPALPASQRFLHLLIDPEAITPTTTITAIRNRPR